MSLGGNAHPVHNTDQWQSVSRQLKSFVPPIDSLPDDVLVDIIQLCIDIGWTYCTHGHVLLFRLSHVCRHWRKLVIASPLLWSHIDVEWLGFHFEREPYSLADTFFRMAQHAPLHVEIDVAESGRVGAALRSNSGRPCIAGILEESLHRCKRLDITLLTSAKQNVEVVRLDRWIFPSLEDLRLKLVYGKDGSQGSGLTSNLPKLTRLYVEGDDCDILDWFPWHQLTTLSWEIYAPLNGILKILTLTERLETLEIGGETFDGPNSKPGLDSHVTLAHLKSLKVDWQPEFMQFICCPALEDFTITGIVHDMLTAFLVRSKPPLKVIRVLESGEWQGLKTEAIVGSIPILEEFKVTERLGLFSRFFTSGKLEGYDIPLTKTLTLNIPNPIDEICSNGYGILFLLGSFTMTNSKLQAFKLRTYADCCYDSSRVDLVSERRSRERIRASAFFQGLEAMRSEGLEVIVSYSPSTDPEDEASREYY
ncbi:hypothetical protein CYLTODRAFT_494142 [Cylindrobasidium torrendii FP15055 ss-10]|uniref:F-box domain-containing protein n=1 Tax=Cylindrobasidium torrendii FP15055 ss-10 TaxID=1314674 RepID=A0A0D7AY08_9AGAR|nr:hypothetical protein CYLTODRAFT_494142 [Cylindrobasidium torrendii FP15055 ss-10]